MSDTSFVVLLVKNGASPTALDKFGNTALHYSAALDNSLLATWLLSNEYIPVNAKNYKGQSVFPAKRAKGLHLRLNFRKIGHESACIMKVNEPKVFLPKMVC